MEKQHLINNEIKIEKVLLLDKNGDKIGEMSLREAQFRANEQSLDLMQVGQKKDANNRHDVAICKILNYESWNYHEQKNKRKQEFKNRSHEMKSIQLRPAIDQNDYELKMRKINEFLDDNHKVKVVIKLKSREGSMKSVNDTFVAKIIESINMKGALDSKISSTFKEINFILKPEKKATNKAKEEVVEPASENATKKPAL